MIKWVGCFILFLFFHPCYAEIYTWTDGKGVVHFSDHPQEGAKSIEIKEIQTYTAPPAPPASTPLKSTQVENKTGSIDHAIKIMDPTNELTIRNPQGYVPVTVAIDPPLIKGEGIQLVLDGHIVGKPQETNSFSLQGIERGSHELVAQVVNAQGEVIKSSEPVTIFMMQPRVNTGPLNQVRPIQ